MTPNEVIGRNSGRGISRYFDFIGCAVHVYMYVWSQRTYVLFAPPPV